MNHNGTLFISHVASYHFIQMCLSHVSFMLLCVAVEHDIYLVKENMTIGYGGS